MAALLAGQILVYFRGMARVENVLEAATAAKPYSVKCNGGQSTEKRFILTNIIKQHSLYENNIYFNLNIMYLLESFMFWANTIYGIYATNCYATK